MRRQDHPRCASITCMIRHYVARRAQVTEGHPHNAAYGASAPARRSRPPRAPWSSFGRALPGPQSQLIRQEPAPTASNGHNTQHATGHPPAAPAYAWATLQISGGGALSRHEDPCCCGWGRCCHLGRGARLFAVGVPMVSATPAFAGVFVGVVAVYLAVAPQRRVKRLASIGRFKRTRSYLKRQVGSLYERLPCRLLAESLPTALQVPRDVEYHHAVETRRWEGGEHAVMPL